LLARIMAVVVSSSLGLLEVGLGSTGKIESMWFHPKVRRDLQTMIPRPDVFVRRASQCKM